jgi:hypothetical protein
VLKRLMVLVAGAGVVMTIFSAGDAEAQGAPDVSGMAYWKAAKSLRSAGFVVKVSTSVGDQQPQDDCLVSGQSEVPSIDTFGPTQFKPSDNSRKIIVLTLNCNAAVASAGQAGSSAASPEARAAELKAQLEWERSKRGQAWCEQKKSEHPEWGWASDPQLQGCIGQPTS